MNSVILSVFCAQPECVMAAAATEVSNDFWRATFHSLFFSMCLCGFYFGQTVKPVKVKIVSANDILTAGIKSPLRCEAWGSAPPGMFYIRFF